MFFDLTSLEHIPSRWIRFRVRLSWLLGFRVSASLRAPDWNGWDSFNLNFGTFHFYFPPAWRIPSLTVFPIVIFRRAYHDEPNENCWGAALLQVNRRFLVGGVSNSERETVDLLFVHLSHKAPR